MPREMRNMTDIAWPIVSVGIATIIVLIGILVVWKVLKDRKSGYPFADERTQKINGKAAYYALLIGEYFIIALLLMLILGREFFAMPELEAGYPLIAASLVFSLTFLALRWYFDKKGELQ
jgi:uncharacterized Tic20 family protein